MPVSIHIATGVAVVAVASMPILARAQSVAESPTARQYLPAVTMIALWGETEIPPVSLRVHTSSVNSSEVPAVPGQHFDGRPRGTLPEVAPRP